MIFPAIKWLIWDNNHHHLVDSLVADDGGLDTSNPANYKPLKTNSLT